MLRLRYIMSWVTPGKRTYHDREEKMSQEWQEWVETTRELVADLDERQFCPKARRLFEYAIQEQEGEGAGWAAFMADLKRGVFDD